jgi:nitrite reductase (NADH) small subunit
MSADTGDDATDRYRVGSLEEVEAQPQVADVRGEKYLVCVVGDETYAYRNVCPHQGGPVAEGRVDTEDGRVVCPWHGWEFELDGGANCFDTDVGAQLPQAECVVEGGDVYLRL